jgi:hypothetical protein
MAQRSKATAEKRRKEVARIEKQKQKAERRAQNKLGAPAVSTEEDFASPDDFLMPLPPPPPDDPLGGSTP